MLFAQNLGSDFWFLGAYVLFNVSIFCFLCKMQSQVWPAVFTFVSVIVANFFIVYLIFYCVMSVTFCQRHCYDLFFTFFQFSCLSVHILMSSVSIHIYVSIFLPVLISIFLPVSISMFPSVSIAIFLPVSIFLSVSNFLPCQSNCRN